MKRKIILSMFIVVLVLMFPRCGGDAEKEEKPNILLITIDTLRRDHLGAYGYYRETSPFIDRLAKKGVMFKHAITPIPATSGSHASILTSLHPLTHNVIDNGVRLSQNVETITEVMKTIGYYTIGAVAVRILSARFNFSQGFDSFSDDWDKTIDFNRHYDRSALSVNKSVFKQIDEYLKDDRNKEKPLFMWVHYYDPHWPYLEWEHISFKNKLDDPGDELRKPMKRYDKEIHYTDEHIKKLYDYLEEKGIARRLVTCITADHGEQFGDHGSANCHADFYSENTFVPLIFHGYRVPKNKTIDTYVSTMDIAVTLLAKANLVFDCPTEGIDLMKIIDKPRKSTHHHSHQGRKLLIIGLPNYTRSLQLLGYPFAYILNFDYHYKYWFIIDRDSLHIEENRFKPVPGERIKTRGNKIIVSLPYNLEKGLKYSVLRADIKENKGLSVKIRLAPSFSLTTEDVRIDPKSIHLNIIYPVTISDRIVVDMKLKKGTILNNIRYTFISRKKFLQHTNADAPTEKKIKNKVFQVFPTLRKKKKGDEFFDLSNDIKMESNLVDIKKFKSTTLEYKKLIYGAFKYYHKKKRILLEGSKENKEFTEEEKKMLKSLGYL